MVVSLILLNLIFIRYETCSFSFQNKSTKHFECIVPFTLKDCDPSLDYVRASLAGDVGITRCQAKGKLKFIFIWENVQDSDKKMPAAVLIGKTDSKKMKHLTELNLTKTCSKIGVVFLMTRF